MTEVIQPKYFEPNILHHGVSYEDYDACTGLRAGDLALLKRSPAHFKAARKTPREPTDALEFGKLFHTAIENPEKFLDTFVVEPEFTGFTQKGEPSKNCKEAREKRARWQADVPPGKIIVKTEWADNLVGMLSSCVNHRLVGALIKKGVRETSLWVQDTETGLMLKCRPDFIESEGYIIDFKSTLDAQPSYFYGEIFSDRKGKHFYILQAAHYVHVAKLAGICKRDQFTIIAIEKTDPWGIRTYPLDIGCLGPGEQWRAHLTSVYKKCVERNEWPGYPERPEAVTPPEHISLPE